MQCKICGNIMQGNCCPVCDEKCLPESPGLCETEHQNAQTANTVEKDTTQHSDKKPCEDNSQNLKPEDEANADCSKQCAENGAAAEDCETQDGEPFSKSTWDEYKDIAVPPEMQQKYSQAGTINANVLSGIKNDLGMHDMAVHICSENAPHPCAQHRQPKEALRAIANKVCPDCGKPFVNESFCRCCGAPVTAEYYQED